jgi:hypothetical protein
VFGAKLFDFLGCLEIVSDSQRNAFRPKNFGNQNRRDTDRADWLAGPIEFGKGFGDLIVDFAI